MSGLFEASKNGDKYSGKEVKEAFDKTQKIDKTQKVNFEHGESGGKKGVWIDVDGSRNIGNEVHGTKSNFLGRKSSKGLFESDIEEGDYVMAPRSWAGFAWDMAWGNDRIYNDGINKYGVDGMGRVDGYLGSAHSISLGINLPFSSIGMKLLQAPKAMKLLPSPKFINSNHKFGKHGKEWITITKIAYEKRAHKLLNSPIGGDIQGFTNSGGFTFRMNMRTGEFGVLRPNGTVETFFRRLLNKEEYWLKQIETYGN